MKIRVSGALAALAVIAAPAAAQSGAGDAAALLGAWQLERDTPRGPMTSTFTFAQDGDSLVVKVGAGDDAVIVGRVDVDGASVSFPFDMRAMMAGMRAGGGPPRAGQARGAQGRAGEARGPGRAGAGGGPQRGEAPQPPRFSGTLQGDEIRGAFAGPQGEQPLVLRRVGTGG
jgi:hypothetical protein